MKNTYERKISSEEAAKGYFLVLKNRLSFFPQIGSLFLLKAGSKNKKTVVDSYHCECQGPEEPHDHYFVRWFGLAKGDRILVLRDSEGAKSYSIRIEKGKKREKGK